MIAGEAILENYASSYTFYCISLLSIFAILFVIVIVMVQVERSETKQCPFCMCSSFLFLLESATVLL